ncbi:MFS transporter [Pelagibius sp. Alg239-R121]|uniref:MFS transporter n=1 Tax=Pelagibius sp. Alg239-R121 TaxID=2993448 RepID=UPI0024A6814F|nr:MFS transporter [Pelagibius sp. Alg239-R121]
MLERHHGGFVVQAWQARRLFAVIPLFAFSTGALYPLIALELSSSGLSKAFIGAVTSAWYLGTFLGSALGGPIMRRFGYRRSFLCAAVLAAFSVWGLNLSDSPFVWLTLRFAGGICLGVYYLLMESWISGLATPATRGRMLASYEAIRITAVALGPLLLLVAATHTAFALIGAVFLFAIVPIVGAQPPDTGFKRVEWREALGLFVCSPCTIALTVVAGFLSSSFYGFGAIYAESQDFSRAEVALFVSVTLLAPAVTQLPVGAIADLFGRAQTGVLVSALAAACAFILAFELSGSFLVMTTLAAIVIGLGSPLYALGHGRLVDGGHELIMSTTAGLIGYNLGTFLGPFGAALAMDVSGPAGLYLWVGLCLLLGSGAAASAALQRQLRCCPL